MQKQKKVIIVISLLLTCSLLAIFVLKLKTGLIGSIQNLSHKKILGEKTASKKAFSPTSTPSPFPTPIPTSTLTPTNTPTPTLTPTPTPILITGPELEELFTRIAGEYSVDKELLKRIANCESGFNTNASNLGYAGLYQFSESLWVSTRTLMGKDPDVGLRFNSEESIRTAAFMISQNHLGIWPNCNK